MKYYSLARQIDYHLGLCVFVERIVFFKCQAASQLHSWTQILNFSTQIFGLILQQEVDVKVCNGSIIRNFFSDLDL